MNRISLVLALAVSLIISSCGYTLVGRGSSLPEGIRSIAIPQFENKSTEPDLDTLITGIVKREFIKDGRLKVRNPAVADSVLEGVIKSYTLIPVSFDENNVVTEYKATLNIMITHKVTRTQKILVKQLVSANWKYDVDPSIFVAETARIDATKEAAERAVESIISIVIEAF